MTDIAGSRLAEAVARALDAYATLAELGEEIEDEWSYVTDLAAAWRSRLDEIVAARGDESLAADTVEALERATVEIARIEDPHRAIDWLSTFPQVVLLALGETP